MAASPVTVPMTCEAIDPRIRRTRALLQDALLKLMQEKDFEKISVQDISEAATVNRATFYDHYADKFALLECVAAGRFLGLLTERGVIFDGTCPNALRGIVLGVCDYLAGAPGMGSERQVQMEPHLESAVVAVVRRMILEGLRQNPLANGVSAEMTAATISSAVYGAVKEWVRTPNRCSTDEMVEMVMTLVFPIFVATAPVPAE
jgi:AcrR family transcriptional regulator